MEMDTEKEVGDMRVLLQSWNVADLLPRLEEQAIGINELYMMKPHHLPELLQNVGLGERIRFEHHLERWRHGLKWPLQSVQEQKHCQGCRCATDYAADTAHSDDSLANSNAETVQANIEPEPVANEVKKESGDEDQKLEALTVLGILKAGGTRSQSLLDVVGQPKCLDAGQRRLLIRLISDYYLENGQRLSLPFSYQLEEEILRLFPKEELQHYRKTFRGKIYVRFINMKGNKRVSPAPPRQMPKRRRH
ncbi:uncharacterized protein LOC117901351 [Drosophila subobscura]|uniref:uncharacterized protein LOC117901351 n=1 Tax=Drosophila subobscura TaxID=7241 RepID=UPI00155A1492|nr:uncharacterized protein LOC117901351 [Drosophila subobscura]